MYDITGSNYTQKSLLRKRQKMQIILIYIYIKFELFWVVCLLYSSLVKTVYIKNINKGLIIYTRNMLK